MIITRAYRELSTCRSYGMGIGPIPWWCMVAWCDWNDLDRDIAEHLITVIMIVDNEIVSRAAARAKARHPATGQEKPPAPPRAVRRRPR